MSNPQPPTPRDNDWLPITNARFEALYVYHCTTFWTDEDRAAVRSLYSVVTALPLPKVHTCPVDHDGHCWFPDDYIRGIRNFENQFS